MLNLQYLSQVSVDLGCNEVPVMCSGDVTELPTPPALREAVETLGLSQALGYVRMLQLSPEDPFNCGQLPDQATGLANGSRAAGEPDWATQLAHLNLQIYDSSNGCVSLLQLSEGSPIDSKRVKCTPVMTLQIQVLLSSSDACNLAVNLMNASHGCLLSGSRCIAEELKGKEEGGKGDDGGDAEGGESSGVWIPLTVGLGLPLNPDKLCIAVCGRAGASNFLEVGFSTFTRVQQNHMALL